MANQDQVVALAGLFQSLSLMRSVARFGMVDMNYYKSSVQSVLALNADSTLDVFGGEIAAIKLGLEELIENFTNHQDVEKTTEITRYLINIMTLEKKLSQQPQALEQVKRGIEQAHSRLSHYELTDETIADMLARTYKQTISGITPKIMVNGESHYLNNKHHADRIRTLLLAAVRATVLWRQKGGVRWRLIFERKPLTNTAQQMLDSINN